MKERRGEEIDWERRIDEEEEEEEEEETGIERSLYETLFIINNIASWEMCAGAHTPS